MKYIILKRGIFIVIVAEYDEKQFEIVVQANKIVAINVYTLLTFDNILNGWKSFGLKQVKKFTVRQNNEKNI